MHAAAAVVRRMLKRNGMVDGDGRILNVDTGTYILGYTEINQTATTPFSRTKTHRAWFSGDSDIVNGALVHDRVDGYYYLTMNVKPEYTGGLVAYYDGTMYLANATIDILRFDRSTKDSFGRTSDTGLTSVATDIYAMIAPVSLDITEYDEAIYDDNSIKLVIQSSVDVQRNDRLSASNGEVYQVTSVDKISLEGLYIVYVTTDVR